MVISVIVFANLVFFFTLYVTVAGAGFGISSVLSGVTTHKGASSNITFAKPKYFGSYEK